MVKVSAEVNEEGRTELEKLINDLLETSRVAGLETALMAAPVLMAALALINKKINNMPIEATLAKFCVDAMEHEKNSIDMSELKKEDLQ